MSILLLSVTSDDVPRVWAHTRVTHGLLAAERVKFGACLLYTSDAADDMQCVDLGGRRIIKKISGSPV